MPIIKKNSITNKNRNNTALKDSELKLKDFGLLIKLMLLPDGAKFNLNDIVKYSKDGMDSFRSSLKTLEMFGYLKRYQEKIGNSSQYIYEITDTL